MAEVVDGSLSTLSPADIHAFVAYLRSIPAISTPDLPALNAAPASDMPKGMAASFDLRGKQVFEGACAGFLAFHLLRGPERDDHTLYSSHTTWRNRADFETWTRSEAFRLAHRDAGANRPLYLGHPDSRGSR